MSNALVTSNSLTILESIQKRHNVSLILNSPPNSSILISTNQSEQLQIIDIKFINNVMQGVRKYIIIY